MASIEAFKGFVNKNPRLITYVKKGEMTWQQFYELYDLYGESDDAWKSYLTEETKETEAVTTGFGVGEIVSWLKNINLDSLQEGVNSLQRVVGVLQDLGNKDNSETNTKEEYKPRPIYKHFED